MIELTSEQRRVLRAAAHHLNPVVAVAGKGLTPTVLKEIERCLSAHELIKVKLQGIERDDREAMLAEIAAQLDCAPVQHIGNTLVLWRPKPEGEEEPKPKRTSRKAAPKTKKQAAAALERTRRRSTGSR
jgi:putative YhbY family RNA-binding protein